MPKPLIEIVREISESMPRFAKESVLVFAAHALVAAEAKGGLGHLARPRVDDVGAAVARGVGRAARVELGWLLLACGVRSLLGDVERSELLGRS